MAAKRALLERDRTGLLICSACRRTVSMLIKVGRRQVCYACREDAGPRYTQLELPPEQFR